jgi:SOS-response transcriptional repressor LexA
MIDRTPTHRQQLLLRFLIDYWFTHGHPPSMRVVARQFRIRSVNGVAYHYREMCAKGLLRRVVHPGGGTGYAPTRPELRIEGTTRGGLLVATVGGPVSMSRAAWVAWLRARLEEAEGVR